MGLLDTLLGRTKPVRANLDALFALPSAAVTLQVSAGLVSTGRAGVCFKPPAGQPFAEMQAELEKMLQLGDASSSPAGTVPTGAPSSTSTASSSPTEAAPGPAAPATHSVRHVGDRFGYRWILIDGDDLEDLVTRAHMVHSSLEDAGWGTQILCSVFGFAPGASSGADSGDSSSGGAPTDDADRSGATESGSDAVDRPVYLVYLAKQGTFYPFAPTGNEQRDSQLELRLRALLGSDLPVESDLSRWFPLWDLPLS